MSSDWVEAIADGKKFYYHKVTRVSVWEIPEDLKSPAPSSTDSNSNNQPVIIGDWKEYKTDKGQKYYYNSITGVRQWEAPPEFQKAAGSNSSPQLSSNGSTITTPTTNTATSQQINNNKDLKESKDSNTTNTININNINTNNVDTPQQPPQQQQQQQQNKEDPIQIFKNLLTDNSISSICTFEKALKSIANDERYQVLKTMSERKQVFLDYQVDRKKVEQEEKRKKEKKAKEDFIQLLRDCKEVTPLMSWRRASLYFESEPRWEAIESERERESLLHDHIQELEQQEKNQLMSIKKEQMKILRQKLESDPSINVFTQWRKVRDQFENDDVFQILDKFDFLTVFENFIRDLEKKLDDQKRLEKEKLKKDSRKDRDNFRELLNEKFKNGELHALTKWKSFKLNNENHQSFINLSQKSIGSTPLELFSDFKDELEIKYENDYKKLKEILKETNFKFSPESTTLESLKSEFSKHPNYNLIQEYNFLPYLEYLKYKEESREKNLAKKKKKRISQFKILLTETKAINKSSQWSDIQPLIESKKEYIDLGDDQERLRIFKDYIEFLVQNAVDEEEDGNEEGELVLSPKKPSNDQSSSKKRRSYIDNLDEEDRYGSSGGSSSGGGSGRDRDRDSRDRDRGSDRGDRRDDRDRGRSSYKKEKR
ncbi:hypothetical protein ACTFIV_003514 [Dictyostelium citrinum]